MFTLAEETLQEHQAAFVARFWDVLAAGAKFTIDGEHKTIKFEHTT